VSVFIKWHDGFITIPVWECEPKGASLLAVRALVHTVEAPQRVYSLRQAVETQTSTTSHTLCLLEWLKQKEQSKGEGYFDESMSRGTTQLGAAGA
jgi:hypothetical protein